jgi:1-acyl-sn-glycerol-3-phosphate acyltransferase
MQTACSPPVHSPGLNRPVFLNRRPGSIIQKKAWLTVKQNLLPKPVAEQVRPEITHLPQLTAGRRLARRLLRVLLRFLLWLFVKVDVNGLENVPLEGPALVVSNHLGDADLALGIAYTPRESEVFAKSELYDFPVLGWLMDVYGMIWVHRGQPDRRALRAALEGLEEGRLVSLAPEGRESVSGGLEEGTPGAAFLALKAGIPVLPVTFTGTENRRLYPNMKRLRRTHMSMTIGPLFRLEIPSGRKEALEQGTQQIMQVLAQQLPPEYRGMYR